MSKFVLDSSVFMQASRLYYPFDVCPGFWRALSVHHDKKRVYSIDRIKKEIEAGRDQLTDWAKNDVPSTFFKATADKAVIDAYAEMVEWVESEPQYNDEAKAEFAAVADGWLVAYASCNDLTVVTQEVQNPAIKVKVPIPNVCVNFDVHHVNTFEMLQTLGVRLVLSTKRVRRK